MTLKIVRNDITRMNVDAIVNTANPMVDVGPGCDFAIYTAAGYDKLLEYRAKNIGEAEEGDVFVTPAFDLPLKYIIHAVSPAFCGGESGEEELLRKCYRDSLAKAAELKLESIAIPLISTGSFGYPKEEGLRIAVDEISAFLLHGDMLVYIVVYDEKSTQLGKSLFADLESYIDQHYIELNEQTQFVAPTSSRRRTERSLFNFRKRDAHVSALQPQPGSMADYGYMSEKSECEASAEYMTFDDFEGKLHQKKAEPQEEVMLTEEQYYAMDSALEERMKHLSDSFSTYFIYLVESKGMSHPDVYKRAIIDKKAYSKIKNNPDAHPKKLTVMSLCMGAMLNIDETTDLMARAGYALSPCDKTDVIFRYFIENGIYDMAELDIQLEEHGLQCIIAS